MSTLSPSSRLFVRGVVIVNAGVFLLFGLAFLAVPKLIAGNLGIDLLSPTGFADFRAMYGGLPFACGLLFALSLSREEWLQPSVFLVAASSAALMLGRIYSALVSGMPEAPIVLSAVLELGSFLWAAMAYRMLRQQSAPQLAGANATRPAAS